MKRVKSLLSEGSSKNEAFQIAISDGLDRKKVSQYLASIPDSKHLKHFSKSHKILLWQVITLYSLGLAGMLPLLLVLTPGVIAVVLVLYILITGSIIYTLYKGYASGFFMLLFMMLVGLFQIASMLNHSPISASFGIVFYTAITLQAIYLKTKLYPYQNFFHTREDDQGIRIYKS